MNVIALLWSDVSLQNNDIDDDTQRYRLAVQPLTAKSVPAKACSRFLTST